MVLARIRSIMGRTSTPPLPTVARGIIHLGESIRLARLRRGLSAELVAERAGMARTTLRRVERGDPGVTIGAYANVLHTLGLMKGLAAVAEDDELGRKLQDAELEARTRAPKRPRTRPAAPVAKANKKSVP
jgi:transcriptional regulator with XRE-family HTH domain